MDQARTLADAIKQVLPALADEQVRAAGEELVSDIRRESNSDSPSPRRLKALATAAMTSVATAAGTEVGKVIIEAAIPLIS